MIWSFTTNVGQRCEVEEVEADQGIIPVTSECRTMGTANDPRETERTEREQRQENEHQREQTQASAEPETPEYKITDWASF